MSKKFIPLLGIVFSILIIIWGFVNYLNISPFKKTIWLLTDGTIMKIEKKPNNIIIKYNYKVNNLEYYGTIIKPKEYKLESEKTIPIYYYYENPNLSFIEKPNEGVYTIAFGILLLILCLLIFITNHEESNKEIDSLTNKIFTKTENFSI
jgi:hypothetical protein